MEGYKISELYKNINYNAGIDYIVSQYINEYDISKANINALLYKGIITQEQFFYLYGLDKESREIAVGKLQRSDSEYTKAIKSSIYEAREYLFKANSIQDNEVLSIRNDAVFLLGRTLKETKYHNLEFSHKNLFTSYFRTQSSKLEFYYKHDRINGVDSIEVKGIKDYKLSPHENHMLRFICDLFYGLENNPLHEVVTWFSQFYEDYLMRKLDIGFYRELGSEPVYKFYTRGMEYMVNDLDQKYINNIDINHNLTILIDIHQIVSSIYFNSKKTSG